MPTDYSAPPGLDEARQGRPWWKLCCVGCFGFLILLVLVPLLVWRGAGGSGPKELSSLPANFPPAITLYRIDAADSIQYFSGAEKQKTLSKLLSPVRFLTGNGPIVTNATSTVTLSQALDAQGQLAAHVDSVVVRWSHLNATRADVLNHYQQEFQRNGFVIQASRDDVTATDIVTATRSDASLVLKIQDLADIEGIDTITATINYVN